MFKVIFETDSMTVTIEDKTAGEDLYLDDAISLVDQGLKGLGYVWDGALDILREEVEEDESDES